MLRPWTQLSASPRTVHIRWKSVIGHIDHAAPRAPRRWRRRGLGRGRREAGEDAAVEARAERSTRVHWFGCGVRLPSPQGLASGGNSRGGEFSAAAQLATGGRSMRHGRRCFGRLEQEDQRLKKHYGRWMDIVRSLKLESFILTKLTKPFVPVNLVGPQVSLPLYWVPPNRGSIHFFCA